MENEKTALLDFGDKECQLAPYESPLTPDLSPQYVKIELSDAQKGRMSAFCQQLPALAAAGAANNLYYVAKWPDGLPHQLVAFADGSGYMSTVRGDGGKFGGHAHFKPLSTQALIMAGFAVMSIVTSQYFLTEINRNMTKISLGIDQILAFLHGNKKAELLSELSFVKYAYENFASIMERGEQRAATLQNIQQSRKVALQDVEFYLLDLHSAVQGEKITNLEGTVDKVFQIRQCLDLSIQLYMTAYLLEVYYSQNYDPDYLNYVSADVKSYLGKYDKQLIAEFNALKMVVVGFKGKIGQKVDVGPLVQKTDAAIHYLMNTEGNELHDKFQKTLYASEQATEYCICTDGTMYLKKEA